MKKIINGLIAFASILAVEAILWLVIIPALWHQGSSAAFRTSVFFMAVGVVVPIIGWMMVRPKKKQYGTR